MKEKQFATIMDGSSEKWTWYNISTKKFSHKYYDTESEAERAAFDADKDEKVSLDLKSLK